MYPPEMRGHHSSSSPTPRLDAIAGTIWYRKGALILETASGVTAAMTDALQANPVVTFATTAVVLEFARASFVKHALNDEIREQRRTEKRVTTPLFEERTVFRSLREAWKTKKIQLTPRQRAKRVGR